MKNSKIPMAVIVEERKDLIMGSYRIKNIKEKIDIDKSIEMIRNKNRGGIKT